MKNLKGVNFSKWKQFTHKNKKCDLIDTHRYTKMVANNHCRNISKDPEQYRMGCNSISRLKPYVVHPEWDTLSGRYFKNTQELLNPKALQISTLYKNQPFQCLGKIFCVEFQRVPLKFHTKYLTYTLKDVYHSQMKI